MNEQPLNLRASLRGIWRRRLLVIVVAVLCGLGGLAYGLLRPVNETAVALVLLPPSTASDSGNSGNSGNSGGAGNGINTDVVIARSTPVLAAAGAKVSPPLGALGMKKLVTVTPLSGQVLQIQAQAPASRYAAQLANAVAASYVDYTAQLESSSAGAAVATLQHESDLLTRQIKNLQGQIDTVTARIGSEGAGSPNGQQDTNLLGSLRSEQNQVSLQLNGVTNQITNAQLESSSTNGATRILQKATAQPSSRYAFPVEAGIIAFAIGLLGGAVFVLVRLQRSRRLRFRDEIATNRGCASHRLTRCTEVHHRLGVAGTLREDGRVPPLNGLCGMCSPLCANGGRATGCPGDLVCRRLASPDHRSPTGAARSHFRYADCARFRGTPRVRGPLAHPLAGSVHRGRAGGSRVATHPRCRPTRCGPVRTPCLTRGLRRILDDPRRFDASEPVVDLSECRHDDELAQLGLQAADNGSVLDGVVVVNPDPSDTTTGSVKNDTVRLLPSPRCRSW